MIYVNDALIEQTTFPDGTPSIRFNSGHESDKVTIYWKFDNMSELFNLICIKKSLDNSGVATELVLPYIPNARMDRVKNPDELFTLKYFADTLNSLNFKKVYVDNAHSNVSLALINNVVETFDENKFNFIIKMLVPSFNTIFFPDEGAQKRYADYSIGHEFNIVTGMKVRDWRSGKIDHLDVLGNADFVKDKDILIFDDICSRGGTFKFSAKKLKEMGAKNIYLYVTHCENVVDIDSLKEAGIKHMYTTDSIYRGKDDFITVLKYDDNLFYNY